MATIYRYAQGNYEFRDENNEFTVEDVKRQLTQYFPELANATTETSQAGADTVVTFVKKAGTKGLSESVSDADLLKLYTVADLAQRAGANIELPPEIVIKLLDELTVARSYEANGAAH